jgi:epoxyqueuosine reductase
VIARAKALGFALAGVCRAEACEHQQVVRDWLGAGKHGSMSYLADDLEARLDPEKMMPGVRSIVMVGDLYSMRGRADDAPNDGRTGRIARYARGGNYHEVIAERLETLRDELSREHRGEQFRVFVDMSPVHERQHALRAGLGWVGKHTLIIHPRIGSWFVLGGIMTTLELEPPPEQRIESDHCGSCTRCIDACPTGAITPYVVDGSRCISYLTIERRGPIEDHWHRPMGDWLFGCDICQEVCPHNSPRPQPGAEPNSAYASSAPGMDLLTLLGWTPSDRAREMRSSALRRARLEMLKRNALIAAGNLLAHRPDAELLRRVSELSRDPHEPELVRTTAQQVLRLLGSAS